jgi:hypothetical protein
MNDCAFRSNLNTCFGPATSERYCEAAIDAIELCMRPNVSRLPGSTCVNVRCQRRVRARRVWSEYSADSQLQAVVELANLNPLLI